MVIKEIALVLLWMKKRRLSPLVNDINQFVMAASAVSTKGAGGDCVISKDIRVLLAARAWTRAGVDWETETILQGQGEFARRDVET